jgi:hypothetical protein
MIICIIYPLNMSNSSFQCGTNLLGCHKNPHKPVETEFSTKQSFIYLSLHLLPFWLHFIPNFLALQLFVSSYIDQDAKWQREKDLTLKLNLNFVIKNGYRETWDRNTQPNCDTVRNGTPEPSPSLILV